MHLEVIQNICVGCHRATGSARATHLVFTRGTGAEIEIQNLAILNTFVLSEGPRVILNKARGLENHGGGEQLVSTSSEYQLLVDYLAALTGQALTTAYQELTAPPLEPPASSLRRASLYLTGKIPSRSLLAAMANADDDQLRRAILDLMEEVDFKEFLKRGANDQLLTRSAAANRSLADDFSNYYPVFNQRYIKVDPVTQATSKDSAYATEVFKELAEEPLELIAYVIQQNKPYSEILTAPYTMVSAHTAQIYQTGLTPLNGAFLPAINKGQALSGSQDYEPSRNWAASRQLIMPHAGVLTSTGFLQHYASSATNRNRARARWTYQHFLGVDIDKIAPNDIDASTLRDPNNAVLNNSACSVCHINLDPVAGAFQNFGDLGLYRQRGFGLNALSEGYLHSKAYKPEEIWYFDMRAPGFEGQTITDQEDSLGKLAHIIVNDERFAAATVKFWWPAIFGEKMLDDSLTAEQYDAKLQTLNTLAQQFKESGFNFKSLLADILMSRWFRGRGNEQSTASAIYTGGKRLLTPEELVNKTASLTSVRDNAAATGGLNLSFGGIDSVLAEKRQRSFGNFMLRAAERHALSTACTIVATEFNLAKAQRRLFTRVERDSLPSNSYKNTNQFKVAGAEDFSWPIEIAAVAGQTLNVTISQLASVHNNTTQDTITLNNLQIIKPDGEVFVSGTVSSLFIQYDWINGSPIGGVVMPYKIRRGYDLKLAIPIDSSGTWTIKLNASAATQNNQLDISLAPSVFVANGSDNNSREFRQQMAELLERTQGIDVGAESTEVLAYTQLFIDLRQHAIARNAGTRLNESGTRCEYNTSLAGSVWAADADHSLKAWRGVLTALMTQYHYLYE